MITKVLGGPEKSFVYPQGKFNHVMLVNAETLSRHVGLERAPYIELLPAMLSDPFEIWASFEKHKGTGKVMLRERVIKGAQIGKQAFLLVSQANKGVMEAWTFIPANEMRYLNNQRVGKLIWKRD